MKLRMKWGMRQRDDNPTKEQKTAQCQNGSSTQWENPATGGELQLAPKPGSSYLSIKSTESYKASM